VQDLLAENIEVIIVCDAVSSQRQYDRSIALEGIKQSGALLVTSESLIFQLLRDATHPKFKQISAIIKEYNDQSPSEFSFSHTL
jgi:hypothetical protein